MEELKFKLTSLEESVSGTNVAGTHEIYVEWARAEKLRMKIIDYDNVCLEKVQPLLM